LPLIGAASNLVAAASSVRLNISPITDVRHEIRPVGTYRFVRDFDLDLFYPILSSDEGPPFSDAGIDREGWSRVAPAIATALLREN